MKSRKFKTAEKVEEAKSESLMTETEIEIWEAKAVDEVDEFVKEIDPQGYEELMESDRFFALPEKVQQNYLHLIKSHIFSLVMVLFGIAKGLDIKGSGWMRFTDDGWPLFPL